MEGVGEEEDDELDGDDNMRGGHVCIDGEWWLEGVGEGSVGSEMWLGGGGVVGGEGVKVLRSEGGSRWCDWSSTSRASDERTEGKEENVVGWLKEAGISWKSGELELIVLARVVAVERGEGESDRLSTMRGD